jgi:hypothetical protein
MLLVIGSWLLEQRRPWVEPEAFRISPITNIRSYAFARIATGFSSGTNASSSPSALYFFSN